jgi:hypothetical protein
MTNARQARAARKARFPLEALPEPLRETVRAIAQAEGVTVAQAAMGALLAVDRVIGGSAALAGPDGLALSLPAPVDAAFLVPDPTERAGVLRAWRRLLAGLPGDARRQAAANSTTPVPRADAVTALADRYGSRDTYLVTAGPGDLANAMKRLGSLPGCACWLDNGTGEVLTFTGDIIAALPALLDALPAPGPYAAVLAVPKTVPAADISAALGRNIPADGSQDMIMLTAPDGDHLTWPMCLVEAIACTDPSTAAGIVRADRDRKLQDASPAMLALVDQADAAGEHAAGIFAAMAELAGSTVVHEAPAAVTREIAGRLPARAAAGQVTVCPHLNPAAPAPAFWSAWAPGLLGCAPCAADAADAIKGTDEDRRCDSCGKLSDLLHSEAVLLPPVVAELPGMLAASGPVTVMYGICPGCRGGDPAA